MAEQWFYSAGGTKHGPVPGKELVALARGGKLCPTDLVWKEGMAEWKPAGKVKGLFPATPPSLPTPAPSAKPSDLATATKGLFGAVATAAQQTVAQATEAAKRVVEKTAETAKQAQESLPQGSAPTPLSGRQKKGLLVLGGVLAVCVVVISAAAVATLSLGIGKGPKIDPSQLSGDLARIQGTWQLEGTQKGEGRDTESTWVIEGDQIATEFKYIGPKPDPFMKDFKPGYRTTGKSRLTLDESTTPPRILIRGLEGDGGKAVTRGIYKLAERQLVICNWNPLNESRKDLTDDYFDNGYPRDFYEGKEKLYQVHQKSGDFPLMLRFVRVGEPPALARPPKVEPKAAAPAAPEPKTDDASAVAAAAPPNFPAVPEQPAANQKQGKAEVAKPVNLLAKADPSAETTRGSWRRDGDYLVSPAAKGIVRNSWILLGTVPAPSYRLELDVERLEQGQGLNLGLIVRGQRCAVVLDSFDSFGGASAIEMIDGKSGKDNETFRKGRQLPVGKKKSVAVEVRRESISLHCDGELVLDWKVRGQQLSLTSSWPVPEAEQLFLGSQAQFKISQFTFRELSDDAKADEKPNAVVPAKPKLIPVYKVVFPGDVLLTTNEEEVKNIVKVYPGEFKGDKGHWTGTFGYAYAERQEGTVLLRRYLVGNKRVFTTRKLDNPNYKEEGMGAWVYEKEQDGTTLRLGFFRKKDASGEYGTEKTTEFFGKLGYSPSELRFYMFDKSE